MARSLTVAPKLLDVLHASVESPLCPGILIANETSSFFLFALVDYIVHVECEAKGRLCVRGSADHPRAPAFSIIQIKICKCA